MKFSREEKTFERDSRRRGWKRERSRGSEIGIEDSRNGRGKIDTISIPVECIYSLDGALRGGEKFTKRENLRETLFPFFRQ